MDKLKYVRKNNDEYGILELQDKILEIMVYIDSFCSANNIDYCLMAGSALGARRHNGFIPWDDDIDIYMTEQEYDRFKNLFNEIGDKGKYYLQEWGKISHKGKQMVTVAKIRLNNSLIQEETFLNWNIHQGIFVDIFILHKCPDEKNKQLFQYICSEAVVLKGLETRGYKPKNLKDRLMLMVAKILPRNFVLANGLQIAYKYNSQNTNYYHGFMDTRSMKRAIFPANVIFPTKYVDFENVKLKVPAINDEYLRIQFGSDYMTPPPVEKIPLNKHGVVWETDENIKYENISDEKKLM